MHIGYVLYDTANLKVLCISGDKSTAELLDVTQKNALNKALCLSDLTSIKNVYERFKSLGLVGDLEILNIAKLQKYDN